MANKEQQVKNSFIYLLPVISGALLPMICLPIFTRILTKEDYGVFALANIYAIFITGLTKLGLQNIYNRNFFQYKDKKESAELLYSIMFFVFITTFVGIFFTFLLKGAISKLIIGSSQHADLLFWAFCSTGVGNLIPFFLSYYRNSENAKAFTSYTITINILGIFLSFFMVVYMRIGVIGLVLGPFVANVLIFSVLTVKFISFLPLSFNWQILKYSLKLAYPTTFSKLFKVFATQFDKYMIGLMVSVGGVGIYSIGQRVANIGFTYMTAIQNVFMPQVYKRMFGLGEKGGGAVGTYLTPFVYISIGVTLLISIFAEEVICILTPESYYDSIDIVIILSMFYGSMFFSKQPQLLFAKKTFLSSMVAIFRMVLNVVINIPFIIYWGAIGAAWATFLAGVIGVAVHFYVSQHYYEIKWEYKKIWAIFFVFFGCSIITIFLRQAEVNYTIRLCFKAVFISLYTYIGIKIKVISIENYLILKNMFKMSAFYKTEEIST